MSPLSARALLAVQLANVTAASVDLRAYPNDPEFRELVWDVRDARRRVWGRGAAAPYPPNWWRRQVDFDWAVERLRWRAGEPPSWRDQWHFANGQAPAEHGGPHTFLDDVRIVATYLKDIA